MSNTDTDADVNVVPQLLVQNHFANRHFAERHFAERHFVERHLVNTVVGKNSYEIVELVER